MGEVFSSISQIEYRLFHRNRFVSDGSPPLVGLYRSALPVFRSRGRGNDWNLVDSIGQPSPELEGKLQIYFGKVIEVLFLRNVTPQELEFSSKCFLSRHLLQCFDHARAILN